MNNDSVIDFPGQDLEPDSSMDAYVILLEDQAPDGLPLMAALPVEGYSVNAAGALTYYARVDGDLVWAGMFSPSGWTSVNRAASIETAALEAARFNRESQRRYEARAKKDLLPKVGDVLRTAPQSDIEDALSKLRGMDVEGFNTMLAEIFPGSAEPATA